MGDANREDHDDTVATTHPTGIWKTFALSSAVITIVSLVALFIAWARNDWDLDAASMIGSAVSPILGIFTVLALLAALVAVRLQQHESARQQHVFLEEKKRDRSAALGNAYAPFLSAVLTYHDAVREYWESLISVSGRADVDERDRWKARTNAAYDEVRKTMGSALLWDVDEERGGWRWQLGREIRLEPWVDTVENQLAWVDVMLGRLTERTECYVSLRESLQKEFGLDVKVQSPEDHEKHAKITAETIARGDEAEKRISEQLKVMVKAEYEQRKAKRER